MILSEKIDVKVCHQNYKHYENIGYQIKKELDSKNRITVPTQYITVKWTDIPHKSNQKIKLKCDICGKTFERKIRYYYLSHENNDIDACSKKCQSVKSMQTKNNKYGTVNPAFVVCCGVPFGITLLAKLSYDLESDLKSVFVNL